MIIFLKLIFSRIIAAVLSLSIKKHNSEIAFLIIIASVMGCFSISVNLVQDYKSEILRVFETYHLSSDSFLPMLKCLIISFITQIACAICKDAGHSAVASSLELTGSIVITACMIPLFETLFQLIGGIL